MLATAKVDGSDRVWKPRGGAAVRIVGAGSYLPQHVVSAQQIAEAVPGWPASQILERTGIRERRYLWPLDVTRGRAVEVPRSATDAPHSATDMAERALSRALAMADLPATDVDTLVVVTCTPDHPRFSHDAMELRRRLGMRRDAHCFVVDSGCGGSLYMLDMMLRMLDAGAVRTVAIVGTNLCSPLIDREVYGQQGPWTDGGKAVSPYLSTYVFGDGAGAVVLRRDAAGESVGARASMAGNDEHELVRSPGGGTMSPSYGERYSALDHAFIVNGRLVAATYIRFMRRCVSALTGDLGVGVPDIERFYLHQPNRRMLGVLASELGIDDAQLASNVADVGNTSSAGMFMLLADDLESGRVKLGSGVPVLFAAIGAGVHYAAQVFRV